MKKTLAAALALLTTASTPLVAHGQAPAKDLIFVHAGRLLADPARGKVATEKTLVISDGRIVEIRDGFQGEGGRVIDLRDSFVLPGLIDSHVHLTSESGPTQQLDGFRKTSSDSPSTATPTG